MIGTDEKWELWIDGIDSYIIVYGDIETITANLSNINYCRWVGIPDKFFWNLFNLVRFPS